MIGNRSTSLFFLFFCTLFFSLFIDAQTPKIDSLKKVLEMNLNKDSARANTLIALCKAYFSDMNNKEKMQECIPELLSLSEKIEFEKGIGYAHIYKGIISMGKSDYEQALTHYHAALKLLEKIGDRSGISTCYLYIGNAKNDQGKFSEAIDYKLKAIKIKEELADKQSLASSYNSIGVTYTHVGKSIEALNYYFKALKIREAINDKQGISSTYLNIGIVMYEQGNVSGSLDYMEKSLRMKEQSGDKEGAAMIYSNIANIYIEQKKYTEALAYSIKAMKIAEEIEDRQIVNNCYLNIANTFFEQKKFMEALPYFLKTINTSIELEDKAGVIVGYNSLGNCYEALKNYDHASDSYTKALSISKEINYKKGMRDAYGSLSSVNEKLNNFKQALIYNKLFSGAKDSLLNEESLKQAAELNTRYQTDSKEKEILLLTKDQQLKDKTLKEQRLIRIGLIIGLGLFLALSSLLFNRYRYKQKANLLLEKQKEIIQQKNTLITDSIDYAKTIQEAILPDDEKLSSFFPEHFILYKPKAIVSGDFYWVGKKEGKVICAVADCTGHGVPGAFMSLLGHNMLENVIQRDSSIDPGAILTTLNEEIVTRFSKGMQRETVKHGMDIALISIDERDKKLEYAGAKNSLYLVRANQLMEIKADNVSTGIVAKDHSKVQYVNNSILLEKGDVLYLFSDGFPDQKGGPGKKKFFYQPFKELLVSIHQLPVDEQKEKLDQTMTNWIGDGEQIDDMLIMGIRC